jgi:hypothetical protein
VEGAIVNGAISLRQIAKASIGLRRSTLMQEVTMAKAGSGIGTHREGRQQRTRQAKQAGAKKSRAKKQSAKRAAEKTLRRLGKTRKHVSDDR